VRRALQIAVLGIAALGACSGERPARSPVAEGCDNDRVALSKTIIVFAPHPDDEVLGFAGVVHAAIAAGHRVRIVVTTSGQAHCQACSLWKSGRPQTEGAPFCTRAELDELGRHRKEESLAGLATIGVAKENVRYLDYDDGTLGAAWENPKTPPPLPVCDAKEVGPFARQAKSGAELIADLTSVLKAEPEASTVFTTHPHDGHKDHASLYHFVRAAAKEAGRPIHVYTAMIHDPGRNNCAYPTPSPWKAPCPSAEELAEGTHASLGPRSSRYHPEAWWEPPPDGATGTPVRYCLEPVMFEGASALKRAAIDAHATQYSRADASGKMLDERYRGWADPSGYLLSFVKRNELFFLDPPE